MPRPQVLILAFLLLCLAWSSPAQAAPIIDPSLQTALNAARSDEMVPVLLLMHEQGIEAAELEGLKRLPVSYRRAEGRARLQALAADTQTDLLRFLRGLEGAGEARNIRALWLINAVAVEIRPDRAFDLLTFGEIRKIVWDPPVDMEEMVDLGPEPAEGWRSIPPSLNRTDDPEIYWHLEAVNAPEAWALGYTGQGVVVAVLDTGVDYTHPDLADRIFVNENEIPDNGIDDDGNGYIDDVRGWDFVSNDNDPMGLNPQDHGTMVAGIVAGDGTSGIATGVAPGATILPIRALASSWSSIYNGLEYAVLMDADIIQMSVTQKWRFSPKPDFAAWRAITDNELALGINHANSIGNEGNNQITDPVPFNIAAPGNCPSPWIHPDQYLVGGVSSVVSVGAVHQSLFADDTSSRGPSIWEDIAASYPVYPYVMPPEYQDYAYTTGEGGLIKPDLCAPGPGTLTTQLGGGYRSFSGTSAATPHVAGAMAILLSADSTLSTADVDRYLQISATDLGEPGKDPIYGSGLLDVHKALQRLLQGGGFNLVTGTVRDAVTDSILRQAEVVLTLPRSEHHTNELGEYRAYRTSGPYTMVTTHFGYESDTTAVAITSDGIPVEHDVFLQPIPASTVAGIVRSVDGDSLAGVKVSIRGTPLEADTTLEGGAYLLEGVPVGIPFTVDAILFNYQIASAEILLEEGIADTVDFVLEVGLLDDFEFDQGWFRGLADTAPLGKWERGDPVGTWVDTYPIQPDSDATAEGTLCYLTQNCNPGAGPTLTDVDAGITTLHSPLFDGTLYAHPRLSYKRWYCNSGGGAIDDVFKVDISPDSGYTWVNLETVSTTAAEWVKVSFELDEVVAITSGMRLRFTASDLGSNSVVEAAVDDVEITESPLVSVDDGISARDRWSFSLLPSGPNPFSRSTTLRFAVPAPGPVHLAVYDVQGRWVRDLVRGPLEAGPHAVLWDGRNAGGHACGSGIYLYRLERGGEQRVGRMVLMR